MTKTRHLLATTSIHRATFAIFNLVDFANPEPFFMKMGTKRSWAEHRQTRLGEWNLKLT